MQFGLVRGNDVKYDKGIMGIFIHNSTYKGIKDKERDMQRGR